MEADRWTQVEQIFQRAREVPADEREAFLRDRCDDPQVREEVGSLLAAREEAPAFFEAAGREVVSMLQGFETERSETDGDAPDLTGQWIGAYRLVEEVGVGGMSVVYRAERGDSDFEQTVAVKLLHRRLHATEAADRFRTERQLLARLDHPNVAQLIDGGVTENGRPYLVMEYVEGVPITSFTEDHELDLEARLDLLDQVFDAVAAAHRTLVVHRDLKPSNVLVAETEEGPRVKLLDFGIAKLLDDSMPVTRPQTRTGQQLMTPAYAAPEQVTGEEVTTATDVYQLGVLAYEVLTGTRPFDLSDQSLTEIERILLEQEPRKPSEVAEVRTGQLRGDLDTILLQALRKDPDRRYGSVEALAADVERHRAGAPIRARPATLTYRTKKFVHRNRTAVASGVLILLLGVAYAVTVTIQANRLAEQRDRAQQEAETAEQVTSFLTSLFEASQPSAAGGDTVTARELLGRGVNRASGLDQQPAVQARMLDAISTSYRALGEYDRAEQIARRALAQRRDRFGAESPAVAKSFDNLGRTLRKSGEFAVSDSLHRAALAIKRERLGDTHPRTAQTLNNLGLLLEKKGQYAAADSLYRKALAMQRERFGPNHLSVAETLNNRGILLREQGHYAAADSVYREALAIQRTKLGEEHRRTVETMHNLGVTLSYRGEHAAADSMLRKVYSIERKQLGADHPSVATTLSALGVALTRKGDYATADSMYRKALRIRREELGPNHPGVATTLNNLAVVLWYRGKYAAVDSVYRDVLAIRQEQLSPNHPDVATTLNNLGAVLRERNKYAAADSMLREAIAIRREKLGAEHPRTATSLYNRAQTLQRMGEYAPAERLFQNALSIRRSHFGDEHGEVKEVAEDLVALYEDWGRPEEGREYLPLTDTED